MKCDGCARRLVGRTKKYSTRKFGVSMCPKCRFGLAVLLHEQVLDTFFALMEYDIFTVDDISRAILGDYEGARISKTFIKGGSIRLANKLLERVTHAIKHTPLQL